MKMIGKEAGTSKEWEELEPKIVYAARLRKFLQNPDLRETLLDTGDKILVEATPDKRWGAGQALNSSAMKRGEFTGANLQGKCLMRARSTLREEVTTARASQSAKAELGDSGKGPGDAQSKSATS